MPEVSCLESWLQLALPGAVAYASSLLGDKSEGEDIAQDCVCRLLAQAESYDLQRDGRKLLFRSITNACLNLRSRRREAISLDDAGRFDDDGHWELQDVKAAEPAQLVIAEELRQLITSGLQRLPIRQRSALELSSLGYRADEIAEMLEVDSGHVRVLLFRGRKAMATFLNANSANRVAP